MEHPESLVGEAELEDLDERSLTDLFRSKAGVFKSPVVIRALVGIGIATLVLIWPQRTDQILARLIGVALIWLSLSATWAALRSRPRQSQTVAVAAIGLLLGVGLLVSPQQSDALLARLIGVAILVVVAHDLLLLYRGQRTDTRSWVLAKSVALLTAGSLLLLFPVQLAAAATAIAAVGWIGLSVLVIGVAFNADSTEVVGYTDSSRLLADWLAGRAKSVGARQDLYDKILFEGPFTTRRVVRFFTLMGFASVIASMGVIADSTAVVIGAMLIAPLMTPLMGMAISLAMGWPQRLIRSAAVAAGGILLAIGTGALLGLVSPAFIDTLTNSQILSRSVPTVIDLVIALAAGAAGAYGLSRPDVSDSLPGVAISISLVPPLAVVGIAWSQADWSAGNGALLLFATNMLAILIMGGLTFLVTGIAPLRHAAENQHRVRTSIATIVTFAAIVVGALLLNGAKIAENLFDQSATERTVNEWLDDFPEHSLVRVDLEGDTVTATIVGPATDAPTAQTLAAELQQTLGRTITADLRLIIEERDVATSEN